MSAFVLRLLRVGHGIAFIDKVFSGRAEELLFVSLSVSLSLFLNLSTYLSVCLSVVCPFICPHLPLNINSATDT